MVQKVSFKFFAIFFFIDMLSTVTFIVEYEFWQPFINSIAILGIDNNGGFAPAK